MADKRILTTRAVPNMILADDVYTNDDQLLVPAGTVLNDEMISALREHSIFAIRIRVADAKGKTEAGIQPIPEAEEQKYFDKVRNTESFKQFHDSFVTSVEHLKDTYNMVVMKNAQIDSEKLLNDVENVVATSRNGIHILDMLHCMRGYNDVTYVHSMNVALLSNLIGRLIHPEMDKKELDVLTLCGLLHDIGKMMISENVILKKGKLTIPEYNLAKTHVLHGNNILGRLQLDPRVAEVAMRHHERCDGSGYPGSYKKDQITRFARIVAIADVYDAMTSKRVYRDPICPFEVIYMFERQGLQKFDPEYLLPFLEKAVQAYVNADVRLSTDEVGKVIMINPADLSRPVVRVGDMYYDLSKDRNINIDEVIM